MDILSYDEVELDEEEGASETEFCFAHDVSKQDCLRCHGMDERVADLENRYYHEFMNSSLKEEFLQLTPESSNTEFARFTIKLYHHKMDFLGTHTNLDEIDLRKHLFDIFSDDLGIDMLLLEAVPFDEEHEDEYGVDYLQVFRACLGHDLLDDLFLLYKSRCIKGAFHSANTPSSESRVSK